VNCLQRKPEFGAWFSFFECGNPESTGADLAGELSLGYAGVDTRLSHEGTDRGGVEFSGH
jgi:hypothetical protein